MRLINRVLSKIKEHPRHPNKWSGWELKIALTLEVGIIRAAYHRGLPDLSKQPKALLEDHRSLQRKVEDRIRQRAVKAFQLPVEIIDPDRMFSKPVANKLTNVMQELNQTLEEMEIDLPKALPRVIQ